MLRLAVGVGTLRSRTRRPPIGTLSTAHAVHGAATAIYGAYALLRPEHLSRQLGFDEVTATRLGRTFGARDVGHGLWLLAARSDGSRRRALALRVVVDAADAVGLGLMSPRPDGRMRGAAAAGSWTAVALTLLAAGRRNATAGR